MELAIYQAQAFDWYPLYTVCHRADTMDTFYTKHVLHGASVGVRNELLKSLLSYIPLPDAVPDAVPDYIPDAVPDAIPDESFTEAAIEERITSPVEGENTDVIEEEESVDTSPTQPRSESIPSEKSSRNFSMPDLNKFYHEVNPF